MTYNDRWQCLEERSLLAQAKEQYIWGAGYIDDLVLRDHNTDTDPEMEQRLYALQDANWNVTTLIEPDADVTERYLYDAYGKVTILDPGFTNLSRV